MLFTIKRRQNGGDYRKWREHLLGCCTLSSSTRDKAQTLKFSSNFEIP